MKLKQIIFLFMITVCLSSCTTVHFKSKGILELYVGGKRDHVKKIEVEGKSEFYFYGIIPKKNHIIYIDEELKNAGMNSAANISIYEYQTSGDMWISFFSMGFYIPTRFKITAFGTLDDDEKRLTR